MGRLQQMTALVVAAGSGSRAGGGIPKQYRPLAGKAVLAHAIDHLKASGIDDVRVVIGAGQEELYRQAIGERILPAPIHGGAMRQQSVRRGLDAVTSNGGGSRILVHDAARPFLPRRVVERLIAALDTNEAAVPVLPLTDTLAFADELLGETVKRDGLVRVQTPQAFRFETLLGAHRRWSEGDATDDAQIVRAAGIEVATVPGDAMLEKLTHEEDFLLAERRLAASLISRTGSGFDVHAFDQGRELWLGGMLIPHSRGLAGHSDADVLLHAVTDALLGAIGAGDIGDHFPPSDPQWHGAPSCRFVEYAAALIEEQGGRIDHVDATIVCEAPKIGPYRLAMRQSLAGLLRVPLGRISIKATTTERLGFTGRGEGIAAQAIATVRIPEII